MKFGYLANDEKLESGYFLKTKMKNWLFVKKPKCEIGYILNNQNAKLVIIK